MDQNKEHNEDDLQREAPTLFGIPKENAFETPDNYFEGNPNRVMDFIAMHEARDRRAAQEEASQTEPTPTPSFFERLAAILKPKVAIPALALVAIAFGVFFYDGSEPTSEKTPEELLAEAVEKYDLTLADWDETTTEDDDYLLDVLMEEDIEDYIQEEVIAEASSNNEEIIDYLLDTDIDLETIIDEL